MIHSCVGWSSGSPARKRCLRLDRSYLCMYAGSAFFKTRAAVGAENMTLTLYFSTICHQMPGSGRRGVPSYMMVHIPAINGP